ncbi:MAG: hypothetical protein ACOC1O_05260 [bacterium]
MKKIIKDFMKNEGEYLVDTAKEFKEEYVNTEIRIGVHSHNENNNGQSYYYYNPVTGEVTEGAGFVSGNSGNYSYREIGDIEIRIISNPAYEDYDSIKTTRIIRPEDEDMPYANDYDEQQFEDFDTEGYNNLTKNRSEYPRSIIAECINCKKEYIVRQEDIEDGLFTELDNELTTIVCSKCTPRKSIEEFLDTIENEDKKEKYKNYLIGYIGLDEKDDLFA